MYYDKKHFRELIKLQYKSLAWVTLSKFAPPCNTTIAQNNWKNKLGTY